MSAVCFEGKYDVEKAKKGIDQFDETYKKYLNERGSNKRDDNWSNSISNTYVSLTGGLDEDFEMLKQQGYIIIDKK